MKQGEAGPGDGGGRREKSSSRGRAAERTVMDTRKTAEDVVTVAKARWRPWGWNPRRNPKGTSRTLLAPGVLKVEG